MGQRPVSVFVLCKVSLAEGGSRAGNCACFGAHGGVDLDYSQLMHALSANSTDSTRIPHIHDGSHAAAAQADQTEGESQNNLPVEVADAALQASHVDGTVDATAHPVDSEPMNGEPQGYFAPAESEQMGTNQCIQGLFPNVEGLGLAAEHQSQQADGTLHPAQSEQIEAELQGNHGPSAEFDGEISVASHGSVHIGASPNPQQQQEQTSHGGTQNHSETAQQVQVDVEPQSSQTVLASQESGQVGEKPATGNDATASQADQIEGESQNNLPVEVADAALQASHVDGTVDATAHPVDSELMNGEPQGYFAPAESEQMGTNQCIQGLFPNVEGLGMAAEHQSQQADGTLHPAQSEQIEAELQGNHGPSAEFDGEISVASHGSVHIGASPNPQQEQEQTSHGGTQNHSETAQQVQVDVEPQSSQTVLASQESGQVGEKPATGNDATASQADQIEGESQNNLPVEVADAALQASHVDGTVDATAHPVDSELMNGEPQGYFAPAESEQMGTNQCIQGLFPNVEGLGMAAEHQSQQADGTLHPAQSEQIEAELQGNHGPSVEFEPEEMLEGMHESVDVGEILVESDANPAQLVQVHGFPQSHTRLDASGENELLETQAQACSRLHQTGQPPLEQVSETSHGMHQGTCPTDANPELQQMQQYWTPAALSPSAEQETSEVWHGPMCMDEMLQSHADADQGQEKPQVHASLPEFAEQESEVMAWSLHLDGSVLTDPEQQTQVQALQVAGFSQQDIVPDDVAVASWATIQQPACPPTQAANSLSFAGCSQSDSVAAGRSDVRGKM